jgi:hypothetical protein
MLGKDIARDHYPCSFMDAKRSCHQRNTSFTLRKTLALRTYPPNMLSIGTTFSRCSTKYNRPKRALCEHRSIRKRQLKIKRITSHEDH